MNGEARCHWCGRVHRLRGDDTLPNHNDDTGQRCLGSRAYPRGRTVKTLDTLLDPPTQEGTPR